MTKPRFKSKSWRSKQVKTPGNRLVNRYLRKNPRAAKCSNCSRKLAGVPRVRPEYLKRMPKTERRPERPYGGKLCSSCMRQVFRKVVR